MDSRSRKRRASHSPSRSTPARLARRDSASAFTKSRHDTSDTQSSRAKSVFRGDQDPYFPLKGADTSLPTGDDYAFRVQVISSTSELETDVFKKAVQGLVKICFPQSVLDELGIEVVTQHMRNEHAPERNIDKMVDIFRSEMIHRVTWMLTECLDTPTKVDSSIKAIMAASASLHGAKIGEDVLDAVVRSLSKLKDKIPVRSTALLANSADSDGLMVSRDVEGCDVEHIILTQRTDRVKNPVIASKPSMPDDAAPTAPTETKKDLRSRPSIQSQTTQPALEKSYVTTKHHDEPLPVEPHRHGKESRISTSWRWDVQDDIALDEVGDHFKRANDLFAYHALPIARQRLGAKAKRKEVRQEIEFMLAAMARNEFEKWVESFQKLENGDKSMLERAAPSHHHTHHRTPATSVPASGNCKPRSVVQSTSSLIVGRSLTPNLSSPTDRVLVKEEHNVKENSVQARALPLLPSTADTCIAEVGTGRPALEINTTDQIAEPVNESPETKIVKPGVGLQKNDHGTDKPRHPILETPVIDLCWGYRTFGVYEHAVVVQTLIEALEKRVSVESIGIALFNGTTIVQTKKELQRMLLGVGAKSSANSSEASHDNVRRLMEYNLQSWVLSNLGGFPELRTFSFVFVKIMPNLSTVMDLLIDPKQPLRKFSNIVIRDRLVQALKARGFPKESKSSSNIDVVAQEIMNALKIREVNDIAMRCRLERPLRRAAFVHRIGFRDLGSSALVRTWQYATKQKW